MKEKKNEIAKEIFSPVIKKFQRIQIQTHYKDECWSIDLIDRSSLAEYNKNYKFIFTKLTIILSLHGPFLLKIIQEKVQQLHLKVLLKTQKENLIKFGQIEVKNFIIKHFWIFLNKMKFKFIHLIQI